VHVKPVRLYSLGWFRKTQVFIFQRATPSFFTL